MYIRKTTRQGKKKTYVNYLLVKSVMTAKGPRQKTICSLGNLEPRPADGWLALAHKVERALEGQLSMDLGGEDPLVGKIVAKVRATGRAIPASDEEMVPVQPDRVEVVEGREAGAVHVGNAFWDRLEVDAVLAAAGLSERGRLLARVMTLNRLIAPASEHAMPDWISGTALADILGVDLAILREDALYRNLDRLWLCREEVERGLAERERHLFSLDDTIYLYDLTSTYFEGKCEQNPQARRGYSRDGRPDCKQVVVGLVVNRDGFPVAHEVFEGNRADRDTVEDMLGSLEGRVGSERGATVVVDRGMAYPENLESIKARGYHYIVATRQSERSAWLDEYEADGWEEVLRETSVTNPAQKKSRIRVKKAVGEGETLVLCLSEERATKDRAIREAHERHLVSDLTRLEERIRSGRLKAPAKIHQAIGRIRERYPRVARYYEIDCDGASLSWAERTEKKAVAESLDGCYLLRTDRKDLGADEIWRIYSLLSRAEAAFRAMKSPLMERPVFHQLQHRVQAHIFLCVLAYHLLVSIERTLKAQGIHTSWETVRGTLASHQVVTVVLPTSGSRTLRIRKAVKPEPRHAELYDALRVPHRIIEPVKTWSG